MPGTEPSEIFYLHVLLLLLLLLLLEMYTEFWWGTLRVRDHLEDPGIDGRIILRWIFGKGDIRAWTEPM